LRQRLGVTEGGLRKAVAFATEEVPLKELARQTAKAESMRRQWEGVVSESRREELDATKSKLNAVRSEITSLRERADAERRECKKQGTRRTEVQETLVDLKRQVANEEVRCQSQSSADVVMLRSEVKAMRRREDCFRNEISKLGYENGKLREAKARAEQLMTQAGGDELQETLAKLRESRHTNAHLNARIEELHNEIASRNGHTNHRQKIHRLHNMAAENTSLRGKLEKANARLSQLEQQKSHSHASDILGKRLNSASSSCSASSAATAERPEISKLRVSAALRRIGAPKPTVGGA
jgi:chromosome segregation ATPase